MTHLDNKQTKSSPLCDLSKAIKSISSPMIEQLNQTSLTVKCIAFLILLPFAWIPLMFFFFCGLPCVVGALIAYFFIISKDMTTFSKETLDSINILASTNFKNFSEVKAQSVELAFNMLAWAQCSASKVWKSDMIANARSYVNSVSSCASDCSQKKEKSPKKASVEKKVK